MSKNLKEIEIDCLLRAVSERYGYDFHNYARASLTRRVDYCLMQSDCEHISELIPKVLHDSDYLSEFIGNMSVTVTEMFRDPTMFKCVREDIVPILRTYSRINIWHAGCATGQEVYSMAILLQEEGLLDRARLYATDFDRHSLKIAKEGIYPAESFDLYSKNYLQAGGKASLANYFQENYQRVKIKESIKEKIIFADHNLTCDQVFAEMHLVICRNVLIYFDKELQNRALNLFSESLLARGFLILGDKETIKFSQIKDGFEALSEELKIYRKIRHV